MERAATLNVPALITRVLMFSYCAIPEELSFKKVALCVKYGDEEIYFTITQKGKAIETHLSAQGRKAKLKLREACISFIGYINRVCPWCRMLIATVTKPSVYNLCKKVGFADYGEFGSEKAHLMVIDYGIG